MHKILLHSFLTVLSSHFLVGQVMDTVRLENPIFMHLEYPRGFVTVITIEKNLKYLKKRNLWSIMKKDSVYFDTHNFYNYLDSTRTLINTDWNMDAWVAKDYMTHKYYQYEGYLRFFRVSSTISNFNNLENGLEFKPLPMIIAGVNSIYVIAPITEIESNGKKCVPFKEWILCSH